MDYIFACVGEQLHVSTGSTSRATGAVARKPTGQGYLILETNYRVIAYTGE